MKIGLDVHGVIDKSPDIFARLTHVLKAQGNEIIIVTGRELCSELFDKLDTLGVVYNEVFSITSYHKEIGTHITYKDGDPTQPLIAPPKWDRTKADFCAREGIDIHIDDSVIYGKYFDNIPTQYILFTEAVQEFLYGLLWGETNL
jgi:hypothetical protein